MTPCFNAKRTLAAVFVVSVLAACGQPEQVEREPVIQPVKLHTVESFSDQFNVDFPAVMQAAQTSQLAFQVNGVLNELPVSEGQRIEQGAVIAKLDQRSFQNTFISARAAYDNAESEYQRARRLLEQDAIARSVVEQRLAARDSSRADLDTARKALEDTVLRAPYSGQVGNLRVENFQNVTAQQAILTFQSTGDVEAVVNVPARLVAFLPQLEPVEPIVTLDVAPELELAAAFKEATSQADPTTQTYRAFFTFSSPQNLQILPGMTGTVSTRFLINSAQFAGSVAVPVASVQAEGPARYVWLVDPANSQATRRDITIADQQVSDSVTVTGGLAPGDVIAAAGASHLFEGMPVREWRP
ncbi:MAG: efflux RND transporter periplasmic adaptor subunit [Pseudomonadota bacterium]